MAQMEHRLSHGYEISQVRCGAHSEGGTHDHDNDSGEQLWLTGDVSSNDISGWRSCVCVGLGISDRTSALLCTNRLVFVPTDTLLKWNETRRGDKDLLSL